MFRTSRTRIITCCGSLSQAINATGTGAHDYTTSQIGNASLAWIRSVVESGPDHAPFFAWLGPHAPHKPSTPAPWYAEHPVGDLPVSHLTHKTM